MVKINLTCIGCPMGCPLTIQMNKDEVIDVSGNGCKKGLEYGQKEVTNPTRIVTSTVPVINGIVGAVPVKTEADIPKNKIFDCIRALKSVKLTAPVSIGDTVISNVCNTGVDIVATKNISAR